MKNRIAITTGDILGVGEEITKKALEIIKPDKNQILIIGKNLNLGYETIEIDQKDNGFHCFESLKTACELANKNIIQGIVTAPVAKEALYKSGYKYNGQTEILEKFLSKNEQEKAEMVFIEKDLRIMLLTRHIALKDIKITKEMIIEKTKRFHSFLKEKCKIQSPKIALLALNPHAGEMGILGDEEIKIINPAIKELQAENYDINGAFSADGMFLKVGKKYLNNEKQEYDGIISMYHDQGLCGIKALCGDNSVNTTIGLKVIRTSPPTGTAYDIKGKNIADPNGMVKAIELMLKLI